MKRLMFVITMCAMLSGCTDELGGEPDAGADAAPPDAGCNGNPFNVLCGVCGLEGENCCARDQAPGLYCLDDSECLPGLSPTCVLTKP